jgi:hypothetical protein
MREGWVSLLIAMEDNPLATWLRSSAWGYPAVETLHILGLALLFGTAVAFDLRLLNMPSSPPVDGVARFLLPLARIGFALAVVSGLVLFMMQARTFGVMPLFFVKMAAVAVAVTNTIVFHRGIFTSVRRWSETPSTPRRARIAAVVSLVCWTLALVCGRFLAYV